MHVCGYLLYTMWRVTLHSTPHTHKHIHTFENKTGEGGGGLRSNIANASRTEEQPSHPDHACAQCPGLPYA